MTMAIGRAMLPAGPQLTSVYEHRGLLILGLADPES
jgi:hypothetical protein